MRAKSTADTEEERKKIIAAILATGVRISAVEIMKKQEWSKSCCYRTLKQMNLKSITKGGTHYYFGEEGQGGSDKDSFIKTLVLFYSLTKNRATYR